MTDPNSEAGAEPTGDEPRRSGRRRPGGTGRARQAGRSSSGEGSRGRRSRRPGDAAAGAPDGPPDIGAGMADPEAVARDLCLRALTGTAKTRQQLADLLHRKEVPPAAAGAVLDRLTEVGLIDDAAFAAAWVSSRQTGRGLARRALASELRAKGVDGEVAAAAVAEVDPQDEWDAARRLVARQAPGMRRLDRITAERRLVGMLVRKGYGGGLAGIVVREALDELFADGGPDAEGDDPAEDLAAPAPARHDGDGGHGRAPARRAAEGNTDGDGGAGGISARPAASMADEVGEGHWEPIARRP